MDMMTAAKTVFSKYVTFSGRASRSEFWWWVLFNIIVSIVLGVIDSLLGFQMGEHAGTGVLQSLWGLATFLPSLAVTVRRLHDTNHSGWWYFIVLIPLIGWLVLLYWMIKPSDPTTNRFG